MTAYLDHAASTPMRQAARAAAIEAMDVVANASSLHTSGRRARRLVEESREEIAAILTVRPSEVIFTSGGTESDNLGVKGLWWSRNADRRRPVVVASSIEHHAVLDPVEWLAAHESARLEWIAVDPSGVIDLDHVERTLRDPDSTAFVTVMWANNEVGAIQPIAALADLCRERGVPLLVDAVQAVGKVPVDASMVDALALSGHKLGGPHGCGVLTARRGLGLVPVQHGGGQDRARSGTYDVPGIVGMAAAMRSAFADAEAERERIGRMRDRIVQGVRQLAPDAILNGPPPGEGRLVGNAHFSFPGCEGDALLMLLDAARVEVSTGSACTSGVPQPSHVLTAMGLPSAISRGSLRFSLGWSSTDDDVDQLLAALPNALDRARRAGTVRLGAFDGLDPAALGGAR